MTLRPLKILLQFVTGLVVSAFALPIVLHRAPGVSSVDPNNSTIPVVDEGIVSSSF